MSRHQRFIHLAANVALKSPSEFRLGAVLCKKNRVLSIGWNIQGRSHPIQQKYTKKKCLIGLHAEVSACLGVPLKDTRKSTLYVARVLRNERVTIAKPCPGCQSILERVGVKQVYFTNREGVIQKLW